MSNMLMRLRSQDERALRMVIGLRRRWIDQIMSVITHLGDAVVAITAVVLLLVFGHGAVAAAGWTGGFTLVVSHVWVQLLKRSVSRTRPSLPVGIESLVAPPDGFSFPSGHAAASLSVALAVIPIVGAPLAAGIMITALLAGMSRCYLGVHYPGDVAAGWTLALAAHTITPFALATLAG